MITKSRSGDFLTAGRGMHDALAQVQIRCIFTPGLRHDLEDLLPGIPGGRQDGVAHGPGDAAGNGLPFIRGIIRVQRFGDVDPVHRHTQAGGCDLRGNRESALADFLPPDAQEDRAVRIELHGGAGAGVGRHGWRFPHHGDAFAALLMGCAGRVGLAPGDGFGHFINTSLDASGVHGHACREDVAGLDDVAHPKSDFVHVDLVGELIHALLDARMQLRHAKAAVGAADGVVGVDADSCPL